MSKTDVIETTGKVEELLPAATFRVRLESGVRFRTAIPSAPQGKNRPGRVSKTAARKRCPRPGQKVHVELDALSLTPATLTACGAEVKQKPPAAAGTASGPGPRYPS